MSNLIMISHNQHSFLLNEVEYAANSFEQVYLIALYNEQVKNKFSNNKKVHLLFFTKDELHKYGAKQLYRFFGKDIRQEIASAVRGKVVNKAYLKHILFFLALEKICFDNIKNIGLNAANANEWSLLSCWYDSDAYVAYRIKQKYPYIHTYTLVHSFEVDPVKSNFIYYLFRKNYHNSFERVSFISRNVKETFVSDVAEKLHLNTGNVEVNYLGTEKIEEGYAGYNVEAPYHIVTCSNVSPVKRVNQFFGILNEYAELPIVWTHFGEGKDFQDLRLATENVTNKNLIIELKGAVQNKDIHQYYISEPVDLFVNYSTSEGIPISIMEAIAYGIPVVATDVGGNVEIVKQDFGKVVNVDIQGQDLWNEIKQYLVMPQKQKELMRHSAAAYFQDNFNSSKIRKSFYASLNN